MNAASAVTVTVKTRSILCPVGRARRKAIAAPAPTMVAATRNLFGAGGPPGAGSCRVGDGQVRIGNRMNGAETRAGPTRSRRLGLVHHHQPAEAMATGSSRYHDCAIAISSNVSVVAALNPHSDSTMTQPAATSAMVAISCVKYPGS